MGSPEHKAGADIREFLEYYVLSILKEAPSTRKKMAKTIEEKSADNEKYRSGGTLRIVESDMDRVVRKLEEENFLVFADGGRTLTLTGKGREALRRFERIKDECKDSKEEAASKLISILVSDANQKSKQVRVMDVGTGEGYLAFKLADAGFRVLGIDSSDFEYSKGSIKMATEKARGNPNLKFKIADIRDVKGMETFDYVVSSQSTHCMKKQKESVCSMCRLIRRGGLLLMSDFLVGLKGFFVHGFHCFLSPTKEKWEAILSACGCENVTIHEIDDFCVVEARKVG